MRIARNAAALRHLGFIAANVRALRRRAGWTQQQLAEAADVDLRFVQRIERGTVNLSVSVLVALATALGVTPTSLLEFAVLTQSRPGRPKISIARGEPGGTRDDAEGPRSGVRTSGSLPGSANARKGAR
jgi:transcriptional regulator with XRE-family HTH domain